MTAKGEELQRMTKRSLLVNIGIATEIESAIAGPGVYLLNVVVNEDVARQRNWPLFLPQPEHDSEFLQYRNCCQRFLFLSRKLVFLRIFFSAGLLGGGKRSAEVAVKRSRR